jgi:predicted tellurium resistance membrane protein TerC
VGLHLFPLAKLFARGLFYGAGAALVVWATAIASLLRTTQVPLVTAIGTGILLWITAAMLLFQSRSF